MNRPTQSASWIAVATAFLFLGLAVVIPSGRHEVGNATIEINTVVFWITSVVLLGLACMTRLSSKTIWSSLAVKSSIGILALTAFHLIAVGVVWRVMGA